MNSLRASGRNPRSTDAGLIAARLSESNVRPVTELILADDGMVAVKRTAFGSSFVIDGYNASRGRNGELNWGLSNSNRIDAG